MDSTADHFVVVEEKNRNFSVIAHRASLTHDLFECLSGTLPVPGVAGITCRCSGPLPGCDQCCDQELFPTFSIYSEIQAVRYLDFQANSQVRWGFTEMGSTG